MDLLEISVYNAHLGVNNKYFALWNSNLPVTKFVSVSIAESRIEWVIISREESFNVLQGSEHVKHIVGKKKTVISEVFPSNIY